MVCSDHHKVAIAAPRGHAKSTAITHTYVLANLCFREKDHVLICSDTEGQACSFLQDIKREFSENVELRRDFGFSVWVKESEREIIGRWEDGAEFRVKAIGSTQRPRGMKWRGKRPNLIIGDDMENDELVLNDARRLAFRKWIFEALLPSGSKSCHIRFVGTILHLDSFLERLMPDINDPETVRTALCDRSTKNKAWKALKFRAHPAVGDYSQMLWPEQYSAERLRREYEAFVEQGFAEGYGQEYLNDPIDARNAFFKKEDFVPIPKEAKQPNSRPDGAEPEEFYAAIDMAISTKDRSAYTVIVVCGLTDRGMLRVRDVRRFRGDSLDIIEEIFDVQNTWKPEVFIIEKENIASSIGPVLSQEMMKPNRPFLRIEDGLPHSADKLKRARSIQYRHRARTIQYDFEADWFPEFQQELLYFPRGKYVDQVDAFAWIGLLLDRMHEVPTWDDQDELEYDEFADSFDFALDGRDGTTGY